MENGNVQLKKICPLIASGSAMILCETIAKFRNSVRKAGRPIAMRPGAVKRSLAPSPPFAMLRKAIDKWIG